MSAINYFLAIMFLMFAGFQINSPDLYIWIPIYCITSILCFLAGKGRFYPVLNFSIIIAFLAIACFLFFKENGVLAWYFEHSAEDITQKITNRKPWIDYTIKFFGLLICLFAIILNTGWYYALDKSERKQRNGKRDSHGGIAAAS